jgi:hypothetical protein
VHTKKIKSMELKQIDVGALETCSCEFDLRKDLHIYVNYIRDRTIKRSVRENNMPKADAKRIAKLLSDAEALADIEESGGSAWLDFIEKLALALGFTRYDTEGEYLGYTSSSPSFPDNYIEFNQQAYEGFLFSAMQKQEQIIFDYLVGNYSASKNEWFTQSIYGRLDAFPIWGCATGVVPGIKFDKVRKFLFDCLASCRPGVWYETASLVGYLKKKHPYFLIALAPKFTSRWERDKGRYCNFAEQDKTSNKSEKILEKDPHAFDRVEGRFVERFLENIPLTLGYVDLAYGMPIKPGTRPSLGSVKAFKINESFLRFMTGSVPEPRVTVHPNHEIHVESQWHPAGMIAALDPFADLISADKICILKLNRLKIIQYLAGEKSPDLKKVLADLTKLPLPSNVAAELDEWAGHSETFILYQGCGLLEGEKTPSFTKDFELETLAAGLRLVRSPDTLFSELETAEQIPVLVTHRSNGLQAPPQGVKSVFTQKIEKARKTTKKELMTITQKTFITLFFQNGASLDAFVKALTEEKCFVDIDKERRTLTYAAEQKEQVDSVMKKLKKKYRIKIVRSQG